MEELTSKISHRHLSRESNCKRPFSKPDGEENRIKEIIFFSGGDANDPRVWSNVPCLYSRTLEKKGYLVHRVCYAPHNICLSIYNRLSHYLRKVLKVNMPPFSQTIFYNRIARIIIKKSLAKYRSADLCIFMGNNGLVNFNDSRPGVIFCESEVGNLIRRNNRTPNILERFSIKRTKKALSKADLVTILFPQDMESMRELSPEINVQYRGGNVINSFYDGELNESEILASKSKSNMILYVGGGHYKEGAMMTIAAFRLLKAKHPELELHIIGMTADAFESLPEGVICHGYLNKDNPSQNKTYYSLFKNAKLYMNPTPRWGAYSSCVEAMYFYNPIIVHPYKHFVGEFGTEIDFGCYNNEFTPEGVAESIERVVYAQNYLEMAKNAHNHVKDYTWDKYIDWSFEELKKALTK